MPAENRKINAVRVRRRTGRVRVTGFDMINFGQ
jgi:hypothetical protein